MAEESWAVMVEADCSKLQLTYYQGTMFNLIYEVIEMAYQEMLL